MTITEGSDIVTDEVLNVQPLSAVSTLAVEPSNLWELYVEGLKTRPVLFKAGTAGTLNGLQGWLGSSHLSRGDESNNLDG
jgi:hypothetical protein